MRVLPPAAVLCALSLSSAGCGLVFDYDPADPTLDASGIDASASLDASVARDASTSDAGTDRCRGPEDCGANDDVCDGIESCDLATGTCLVAVIDCAPPEVCQAARCDPRLGCAYEAETCEDDGIDCTIERCDPVGGGCISEPDDTLCGAPSVACRAAICDPATGCGVIDVCVAPGGTCDEGSGLCSFPDCTDSCVPIGPCAIDAYCDSEGRCVQEHADPGTTCMPNACRSGVCDVSGFCTGVGARDCDDSNPCTDDSCDNLTGCRNLNASTPRTCDTDADLCTIEACNAGLCVRTGTMDCLDSDAFDCATRKCDGSSGLCIFELVTSGTCDDRDPCTINTMCTSTGSCEGMDICGDRDAGGGMVVDAAIGTVEAGVGFP